MFLFWKVDVHRRPADSAYSAELNRNIMPQLKRNIMTMDELGEYFFELVDPSKAVVVTAGSIDAKSRFELSTPAIGFENLSDGAVGNLFFNCRFLIQKRGFNAFENANAGKILNEFIVREAVLTGVNLNGVEKQAFVYGNGRDAAIESESVALKEHGFEVIIVKDAIPELFVERQENAEHGLLQSGIQFANIFQLIDGSGFANY